MLDFQERLRGMELLKVIPQSGGFICIKFKPLDNDLSKLIDTLVGNGCDHEYVISWIAGGALQPVLSKLTIHDEFAVYIVNFMGRLRAFDREEFRRLFTVIDNTEWRK